jgi:hypothetical protein
MQFLLITARRRVKEQLMTDFGSPAHAATFERPYVSREGEGDELDAARDLVDYLREYARQKPEVAALWCFGIGFVLGWKLKPW